MATSEIWDGTQADLVACAVGAVNALGMDAYQTWAFWRAEANAFVESPFRCPDGTRATFAVVQTLPPTCFGVSRMAALAERAFSQLAAACAALGPQAKIGRFIGAPERFGTEDESVLRQSLEAGLERALGLTATSAPLKILARGNASLAFAVQEAGGAVMARALDAAIVGGVDSYYDGEIIDELLDQDRLLHGENIDSLIPGEGAAFLLLARAGVAKRAGLPVLAHVEAAAVAREPAGMLNELPSTGAGLTRAMRQIVERLKAQRRELEWILGDLTNESYRAQELQMALPRVLAPGGLDDAGRSFQPVVSGSLRMDFVPVRFGDLGAATMPTAALLAGQAFVRGDPSPKSCLLLGSAVEEDRGAVLLSKWPDAVAVAQTAAPSHAASRTRA